MEARRAASRSPLTTTTARPVAIDLRGPEVAGNYPAFLLRAHSSVG